MTQLTGRERAQYVQSMFARIAHRYDLMNRLMTGGQDIRWRKEVIHLARLRPHASLLDLGTGTGDLAREALTQFPQARGTAADFTLEMMRVGKKNGSLNFSSADALNLPFKDRTFDAVVSGFLMRNVTDVQQALKEQAPRAQTRRADRHPRHHAPEEKPAFAVHQISHARGYPLARRTALRRARRLQIPARHHRGFSDRRRTLRADGGGWVQESQFQTVDVRDDCDPLGGEIILIRGRGDLSGRPYGL
ncbi:MAG: class I SAM-dependent methyltransferase [Chloroflexi bacterium]|nr:class I SAM-dependent methyltransferase [Chloroflexota bacterium]